MTNIITKTARTERFASERQARRETLNLSEDERLTLGTYLKLHRAWVSLTARLAPVLAEFDLTLSQFSVLEALHNFGAIRQCEVSDKIMKSDGNVTMVIKNLERMELVSRKRLTKKHRDLTVFLTPAGGRVTVAAFQAFKEALEKELSVLTPEEKATLGKLSKRLGRRDVSG